MPGKILTEYRHDGRTVRLTLNDPKGNILDSEMMSELQRQLDSFKERPELKLIEFTGAGSHFCFGASVQEHVREQAPQMLKQFHGLFYTLLELAIPTSALVSGQCLGGGMELALICNFIFLDKTAKLGQPEISLAVFPPPASVILPLRIGQGRADDLLLTGRIMTPDEAMAMGLGTQLFDTRDDMLAGVDVWIEKQILPKSASSLRFGVRAARATFNETVQSQLKQLERLYVNELMATADANEGIASFLERRPPAWEHN